MANEDVNVTLRSSTANAQQAWLQMIGILGQFESRLKRAGRAGRQAGRETQVGMTGAAQAMRNFGTSALAMVGVGSPLVAILTTVQLIKSEMQAYKQLVDNAIPYKLQESAAFAQANVAMGQRHYRSGEAYTPRDLQRQVTEMAREAGVSAPVAYRNLEGLFSSSGTLDEKLVGAEDIVSVQFKVAESMPHLKLPQNQEELQKASTAVVEIMKSEALRGDSTTVDQAIAMLKKAYTISRAENMEAFGRAPIAFASEVAAKYPEQTSFDELMAYHGALSQVSVDIHGRRTTTGGSQLIDKLYELVDEIDPSLRTMGFEELRDAIKNADDSTPSLNELRKVIQTRFAPELKPEDIAGLDDAYKRDVIQGPQRQEGAFRASFIKDSAVDLLIERGIEQMGDSKSAESVAAEKANRESLEGMEIYDPIRQEAARISTEEAGMDLEKQETMRAQIITRTRDAVLHARQALFGSSKIAGVDASLERHFGDSDPVETGRKAIRRLDAALTDLQRSEPEEGATPAEQAAFNVRKQEQRQHLENAKQKTLDDVTRLSAHAERRVSRELGLPQEEAEDRISQAMKAEEIVSSVVPLHTGLGGRTPERRILQDRIDEAQKDGKTPFDTLREYAGELEQKEKEVRLKAETPAVGIQRAWDVYSQFVNAMSWNPDKEDQDVVRRRAASEEAAELSSRREAILKGIGEYKEPSPAKPPRLNEVGQPEDLEARMAPYLRQLATEESLPPGSLEAILSNAVRPVRALPGKGGEKPASNYQTELGQVLEEVDKRQIELENQLSTDERMKTRVVNKRLPAMTPEERAEKEEEIESLGRFRERVSTAYDTPGGEEGPPLVVAKTENKDSLHDTAMGITKMMAMSNPAVAMSIPWLMMMGKGRGQEEAGEQPEITPKAEAAQAVEGAPRMDDPEYIERQIAFIQRKDEETPGRQPALEAMVESLEAILSELRKQNGDRPAGRRPAPQPLQPEEAGAAGVP